MYIFRHGLLDFLMWWVNGFTHGVIYDFIHKLQKNPNVLTVLGDGEQIKPYLYVKDLIGGILFICKNSHEEI